MEAGVQVVVTVLAFVGVIAIAAWLTDQWLKSDQRKRDLERVVRKVEQLEEKVRELDDTLKWGPGP